MSKNDYFDGKTHKAIVDFNDECDFAKKHKIYDERIRESFENLVKNLLMVYKFSCNNEVSYDTLVDDCVSYLYEKLYKFDPDRGSKAFSYFNVVAKNYLLAKQYKESKKRRREISYSERNSSSETDNRYNLLQRVESPYEETLIQREEINETMEEIRNWKVRYKKDSEVNVLDGIIYLLEHSNEIDIINKKSIYLYLREITGMSTKQIVAQLNKFRRSYGFYKKRKKYFKDC
jgi:DNA-directed RNA polymerase specialized sigma24 family protein